MMRKFTIFFLLWSGISIQPMEQKILNGEITKRAADLINYKGDGTNFRTRDNHIVLRCVNDGRIEFTVPYNKVLECDDDTIKNFIILVMQDYASKKKDENKTTVKPEEKISYRLFHSEGTTNFIYGSILNPDIKKLVQKPLLIASCSVSTSIEKSSKRPKLPKLSKLRTKSLKHLPPNVARALIYASKFSSKLAKKAHI